MAEKSSAVGNVKAMREALEEIDENTDLLDIAEDVAPNLHPSHSFVAVQIRKIARAALSAPPRNCDRFESEAGARKAFIDWYNTVYGLWGDKWNEVSSCDLKHNVDDILQEYIIWLFATAEGKEASNG